MGVDLSLLPLASKVSWASFSLIKLERRSDLWEAIEKIPTKMVPKPLACLEAELGDGETGFGYATEDKYGSPLTYTTASALLTLKDHEAVQDNWTNRAIWAYLEQMPKDWPIALFWS